jgi:hypothetical protein
MCLERIGCGRRLGAGQEDLAGVSHVVVNQVDKIIAGRDKTYYVKTLTDNQDPQADCSTDPGKYSGQVKRIMKFSEERQ